MKERDKIIKYTWKGRKWETEDHSERMYYKKNALEMGIKGRGPSVS